TVIERNVEVGQTVAASLSAPQLFLIANDLSRLQILASVDESDIGRIEEGQEVRFTVQAYPEDTFIGTVRQVRLQSSMQENVVNYTVVVDVNNDDGRLLPGMTATLDFLIETASDVFKVANAALRFRPTEDMVAEMRARRQQARENRPDSLRERFGGRRDSTRQGNRGNGQGGFGGGDQGSFGPGGGQGGFGGFGGRQGRSGMTMLWYVDETGNLAIAPVRTGITDGESTEIMGRTIEPGMQVIAGVSQGETPSASTNPFQSQQQGGRRRPGGF
ncbi:MAG TPA: efflux RND transporter periplasmic adaptor subunit, partial [Rhodothermales bacterium]|nr:efflux RND transporter periplasmic adaptor subunit [Rhodothermales bacterium]